MAGLDPAIHRFSKKWIAGSSPVIIEITLPAVLPGETSEIADRDPDFALKRATG
jgi:hypothetical protein